MFRSSRQFLSPVGGLRRAFHNSAVKKSLYGEPVVAPVEQPAKSPLWKKLLKFTFVLTATGTTLFLGTAVVSLYGSLKARKYVTREDMHDYRSMDRNIFTYTEEEMEDELMESAVDVDEQAYEIMEERELLESSHVNEARAVEAKNETVQLLRVALFGTDLESKRAWNDYYSFYYTYIELDALQKMREDGYEWGTKEAEKRWR